MNIHIADKNEISEVLALRVEVFVNEQNVPPEIELDSEDAHAIHIIAKDGELTVGCARVILSGNEAHIGRLAVKKSYRRHGVGSAICSFIVDLCRERSVMYIWLNSQLHAVGFYEKLGFVPEGENFFEAGIEHIKMVCK